MSSIKPNILFLVIDPLNSNKCFRDSKTSKTSNIDSLIKNGIYFSMPRYLVEFSEKISSIIYNAEMVRFAKTGSDARTASVRVVKTSTVKQSLKGNIMKTVMTF